MKTIQVRVIPRAKKNRVEKFGNGFKAYLSAPPAEGKANKVLLEALAGHLKVKKSQLRIIRGRKSRDKIIGVS